MRIGCVRMCLCERVCVCRETFPVEALTLFLGIIQFPVVQCWGAVSRGRRNVNGDLFVLHKEINQIQATRKTQLENLDSRQNTAQSKSLSLLVMVKYYKHRNKWCSVAVGLQKVKLNHNNIHQCAWNITTCDVGSHVCLPLLWFASIQLSQLKPGAGTRTALPRLPHGAPAQRPVAAACPWGSLTPTTNVSWSKSPACATCGPARSTSLNTSR